MTHNARTYYILGVIIGMMMLFVGCEEPMQKTCVQLPLEILIPAEGESMEKRILGDPGTYEDLKTPKYLYIFCVFIKSDDSPLVKTIILEENDIKDKWGLQKIGNDLYYIYVADPFYVEGTPDFGVRKAARVYAAASNVPLTLQYTRDNNTIVIAKNNANTYPTTEDEVKNILYPTASLQDNIQNIYSTPCEYEVPAGTYYGTVENILTSAPYKRLVLYHVASKVDIMWNVSEEDDLRSKMRVTKVKAKNLYNAETYLFKPTKKTHAKITSGYTPNDLAGNSAGTWWSGRTYFYALPYIVDGGDDNGKFPIEVDFELTNVSGQSSTYTYGLTLRKAAMDVFAPWMRGQVTVSTLITENKSKTVDLE